MKNPGNGKFRRPLTGIILVIGDVVQWQASGRALPDVAFCEFLGFEMLSTRSLAEIDPDVILAPLTATGFDALDVAKRLARIGFTQRVRIMSPKLPNPEMIEAELMAIGPGLDISLIEVPMPKPRLVKD